jgi:hypothetical protein
MIEKASLINQKAISYKLDGLERILYVSFQRPRDVNNDTLGIGSYYKENMIHFEFPVTIIVGQK